MERLFYSAKWLQASTTYKATITTAAKNEAGTPLAQSYVWTFKTGATVNNTPAVISTDPAERRCKCGYQ